MPTFNLMGKNEAKLKKSICYDNLNIYSAIIFYLVPYLTVTVRAATRGLDKGVYQCQLIF